MKTDFHNKDFALSLDLKWRLMSTHKWPIRIPLIFSHTQISRYFCCTIFNTPQRKKKQIPLKIYVATYETSGQIIWKAICFTTFITAMCVIYFLWNFKGRRTTESSWQRYLFCNAYRYIVHTSLLFNRATMLHGALSLYFGSGHLCGLRK